MIGKLLIANRGEIACRIIRTCKRMGIGTVAVYSDADVCALHTTLAEETVRIGPREAAQSYLNAEAIIAAALAVKADAIHPGYGFLSERSVLPELCAKHGIVWVGPSADAIRCMGSKIESKRIAQAAGVEDVPGYPGDAQDDAAFLAAAKQIGYPVLVKASAGGGGRGMRRAANEAELVAALPLARREAEAGFGDAKLLLEKLIQAPRHLEVQLAGDKHGNLVHLFERECSIQRNYQKVIEEAPAPRLPERVRTRLFEAALKLGRAINYDSLGTVEFIIADGQEQPYFLEVNTRLQVEHPVTELVTGLDLVEWQLRIASGEKLPLTQAQVTMSGAAIEARLTAEDAANDYRPQTGVIAGAIFGAGEGVRVDSGVTAGSQVSPYYDSLLAKIIGFGADRAAAAQNISRALRATAVFGLGTNQTFLRDIIEHPRFLRGELTTQFLTEVYPKGWSAPRDAALLNAAVALWAFMLEESRAGSSHLGPFLSAGAFRVTGPSAQARLRVEEDGVLVDVSVGGHDGRYDIARNDRAHHVVLRRGKTGFHAEVDGVPHIFAATTKDGRFELAHEGVVRCFHIAPAIAFAGRAATDALRTGSHVVAPMPGLVNVVEVAVGQQVAQGQTVVVMEAMKLMIRLPAPMAGRVTDVLCSPKQIVGSGAILVKIEPGQGV